MVLRLVASFDRDIVGRMFSSRETCHRMAIKVGWTLFIALRRLSSSEARQKCSFLIGWQVMDG